MEPMRRDVLFLAAIGLAAAAALYWLAPRRTGPCPCNAERAWVEDGELVCKCAGEMGLVRVPSGAPIVAGENQGATGVSK
jgi:hypothetical protein